MRDKTAFTSGEEDDGEGEEAVRTLYNPRDASGSCVGAQSGAVVISDADQVRSSQTPHMRLLLVESSWLSLVRMMVMKEVRLVMLAGNVDIRISLRAVRMGWKWNERFNGEKFLLASV